MRKLSFLLLISFLVSCATTSPVKPDLRAGRYEAFYQNEIDQGLEPGVNTIFGDGAGVYELKLNSCEVCVENFRWKITGNTLILENYDNYLKDVCKDIIVERYDSYTQYFKIMERTEDALYLTLEKDVAKDGSEEFFDYPEPYIWKFVDKIIK